MLPPNNLTGGLAVVGGLGASGGATSRNTVHVSVWGTKFAGNEGADVSAWGARTTALSPAGTSNAVTVELNGVSKKALTEVTPSVPTEVAVTNFAIILR